MNKTDFRHQKLAKVANEVVDHFQHWSGDFISEELEKYNANPLDLQDGLESWYSSLAILGSVSESLYAVGYPVVENESPSDNVGVKPHRIPEDKTLFDSGDSLLFSSFESTPLFGDLSDSQNDLTDKENAEGKYVDFEETQSGEPFLSDQDKPHEVNEFSVLRSENFEKQGFENLNEIQVDESEHEIDLNGADNERNEINLDNEPFGNVENFQLEKHSINLDQTEPLESTHSIGGFGDFLNAVSSEQANDKKTEEPRDSSTPDTWSFTEEYEPGTDHIKLNGRANGQKSERKIFSRNQEHTSQELTALERSTDSLFKNEELFEEFSKTIKQAYHKYYGKY